MKEKEKDRVKPGKPYQGDTKGTKALTAIDLHGLESEQPTQETSATDPTASDWVLSLSPRSGEDDALITSEFSTSDESGTAIMWTDSFQRIETAKAGPVIGIARQQRSGIGMWECLFNFEEVAAAESATAGPCGLQYKSQAEVLTHYATAHFPFSLHEPSKWFKCRGCEQWNDVAWYCLKCEMVDCGAQEEWLCGFAVPNRLVVTDQQFDVTKRTGASAAINQTDDEGRSSYLAAFSPVASSGRNASDSQKRAKQADRSDSGLDLGSFGDGNSRLSGEDCADEFEKRLMKWGVSMRVGLPPEFIQPCPSLL